MRRLLAWLLLSIIPSFAFAAEPGSDTLNIAYGADTTCDIAPATNRGCQVMDFYKRTGGSSDWIILVIHGGGWFTGCRSSLQTGCSTEPTFADLAKWFRDTTWDGTSGHAATQSQKYSVVSMDYRLNTAQAGGTRYHCDSITDDVRHAMNYMFTNWGTTHFILTGHSAGVTTAVIAMWSGNPYASPSCGGSVNLDGSITVAGIAGTGFVGKWANLETVGSSCPGPGSSLPRCRFEQFSGFTDCSSSCTHFITDADPIQNLDSGDIHFRGLWGAQDEVADCHETACDAAFNTACTTGPQLQAAQAAVIEDVECPTGLSHNAVIQCGLTWNPAAANCAPTASMFGAALADFDPVTPPVSTSVIRSIGGTEVGGEDH